MKPETYLGAAFTILAKIGRHLTSQEITAEAIREGLIKPSGKTPEASMASRLYMELNNNPETILIRMAEPGPTRARRGSVRWTVRTAEQRRGPAQK